MKKVGNFTKKWRPDKTRYYKYLHSPEWKAMRCEVFRIHGRKCSSCGSESELEVNHKHYRTLYAEDPETDLEVLCRRCHKIYHGRIYKSKKETRKQFKKRRRKFARVFGGGTAMTIDDYYARRGNKSTNGSRPFKG